MSLWQKLIYGVDVDAEVARGSMLDQQIAQKNLDLLNRGVWTAEDYAYWQKNAQANDSSTYPGQVDDAFNDGLKTGYDNVTGTIKKTLNAPFSFAFDSIPAWLLLAGAVALAWYFGLIKKDMFK